MENKKDYYMSENNISTFDFMQEVLTKEEYQGLLKGNIIKYLSRNGKKENADDDLEKAKHYSEGLIDFYDEPLEEIVNLLVHNNFLQAQLVFNEWREEVEQKMLNNNQ